MRFSLLLCTLAACSAHVDGQKTGASGSDGGSSAGASSAGTSAGGSSGTSAGSSAGGSPSGCTTPPGFSHSQISVEIASVSATIVDAAAHPVDNQPGFAVRGYDLSFPGTTDASGTVTIAPNHALVGPKFVFGDGLSAVTLLARLESGTTALATLVDPALPVDGATLAAGAAATSNDVTLTLAAGATITFDTLTYDSSDKQKLRATVVPLDHGAQDAVSGISENALAIVYGVAPLGTVFCPNATVTVPNTLGWSAGAAVQFFILGSDTGAAWAPFGSWQSVSTGHVSSDGTSVSTDDGAGFAALYTFGVKLAP